MKEQAELIESVVLPVNISAVGGLLGSTVFLKRESGEEIELKLDSLQLVQPPLREPADEPIEELTRWQTFVERGMPGHPEIINEWRSRRITLEQALLDIHSGRLFGAFGVWLVDLFGLFQLMVALSGLVVWFRRKRRRGRSTVRRERRD